MGWEERRGEAELAHLSTIDCTKYSTSCVSTPTITAADGQKKKTKGDLCLVVVVFIINDCIDNERDFSFRV